MSVLHIVRLPGIEPGLYRGFALILEVGPGEPHPDAAAIAEWKAFGIDTGARGLMVTNLLILDTHQPAVEPGPCPSYMEGLGVAYTCDLRDTHSGLHEATVPGLDGAPPTRATWGDRVPWRPAEHEQAPPSHDPEKIEVFLAGARP